MAVTEGYRGAFPAARIGIEQVNSYPGLETDPTTEFVSFAKSLAQSPDSTSVTFGTEAGVFAALGIPTVVCGPGSMATQGHKPDESIGVAELADCDAFFDRLHAAISR